MPGNRGCVACGASNLPTAQFCAQCGASLPPIGGQPAGNTKSARLVIEAREHLTLRRYEEAALTAEAALVLDANSAEAHHIAAQARLKQGMNASALRHAERAVALDPGNPEYHATLLAVQGHAGSGSFDWNRPGVIAAGVALLVLLIITVVGLNMMSLRAGRDTQADVRPTSPTGQLSPYSATAVPGQATPQPVRPTGVLAGRPRVPSRAATPRASDLTADSGTPSGQFNPTTAVLPPVSSSAVGLAPAPVDASPLNRFSTPQPAAPSARASAAPAPAPRAVVEPPAAHPGGGTLFGGNSFPTQPAVTTPAPDTTETPSITANTAATVTPRPSSPQQAYMLRDYGAAIRGFQQRIDNGEATGANYQQLGLAYERVSDKRNAAAAYRAAILAYQAQLQSGADADVAQRGLRSTQRALMMLETR
jgi:tetratricopeptide (TPR) repeat protein